MKPIVETLKDFIDFLKNPVEQKDQIQTIKQKSKRFFSLLVLDLLVAGIVLVIVAVIKKLGLDLAETYAMYELFEILPVWGVVLVTVIVAPLLEELAFRLPLRFRYNFLARLIILLASIAGKRNKIKVAICLRSFWRRHFRWIFFSSAIVFGLIHLTNYELSPTILLFAPLLIFSQFVGGLMLGYLRVKYNLMLAILLHSIFNGILIVAYLIYMNATVEKWDVEKADHYYSIKIKEASIRENQSASDFSPARDSINFHEMSLKSIINILFEKDEFLSETNNPQLADTKINLILVNHARGIFENKEIILKHLSDLYNFDVEVLKKEHEQGVWNLVIRDTVELMKYKSKTQDEQPVHSLVKIDATEFRRGKSSSIRMEFENAELPTIANSLKTNLGKFIIANNDITSRFNFTIFVDMEDFQAVINSLALYGLSLEKADQKVEYEYIYINFKQDKN